MFIPQNFDLTQKKKKKTKKYEFDDDEEKSPETPTGGEPTGEPAAEADGDLDDFSGMKKKKKKKKAFNLDELDEALPSSEKASPDEPSENVEDMDFDFSSKKKKKKKKVTDAEMADDGAGGNKENDDGDVEFEEGGAVSSSTKWDDSDRDYTYDEMLELIYNQIKEKNPDSETGGKKKLVMRPPQVLRVGTKKTSFANFVDIAKR